MSNENVVRDYKLMYKAFEMNLAMPQVDFIASQIFLKKECSVIQCDNNLSFLKKAESAIADYVYRADLDYKKDNKFDDSIKCECDYDCECSLNIFSLSAFKNISNQFLFDGYIDRVIDDVLDEYTDNEKNRLQDYDLIEVFRVILHKYLAILAHNIGLYHISCKQHEIAILLYGGLLVATGIDPNVYINDDITKRARAANEVRWQGHVEQLRRKYLELDESRQDKTGKKPTIKAVATWIFEHHNENNLEFETIRDHLSKARKGIFTNT